MSNSVLKFKNPVAACESLYDNEQGIMIMSKESPWICWEGGLLVKLSS